MTFSTHDFTGQAVFPAVSLKWAGGPAVLHMERFPSSYRFPEANLAVLAPRERQRLDRAVRPDKAHRALAARYRLRMMLAEVLNEAPEEIALVTDAEGRAGLDSRYGIARDELDFSVSYEPQGLAVCLAHRHRVGVDIQRFSHRQKDSFDKLFGGLRARKRETCLEIQEIWTRMEAYGKMQGEGLGHGLHRLYQIAIHPEKADIACNFFDFRFGLGTSIALCLSGRVKGPVCIAG